MQPDKQPAPPLITYRRGLPAWNVKIRRGPTAEECAAVFADYGEHPPEALARPGTSTGDALPWGPAWIEAYSDRNPEAYWRDIGEAARDGFELAQEQAREIFGPTAEVYSDGRSGGWLVLRHPSVTRVEIDAAEELLRMAEDDPGNPALDYVTADELRDARELLDNLDSFGRYVASALADHGRAQAYWLFRSFQCYAQEYADELAEKQAAARLETATLALVQVAEGLTFGGTPERRTAEADAVRAAVTEYRDAARAAKGGAA